MAFKYIERIGVQWGSILTQLRNDLVTFDGWTIYDDMIGSNYFVMQMLTEEGIGNELHIRFILNADTVDMELGYTWNATTHAWVGSEWINDQYWYTGMNPGATGLVNYRLSGDENYMIGTIMSQTSTARCAPFYIGLLQKYDPVRDTEPRAATLMGRYYRDGFNVYYNDYNRTPILKGYNGMFNAEGRVCKETPFLRGGSTEEFLNFGPWGPNKYIFSGAMSVFEHPYGMRGYLRGVRSVSGANGTTLQPWDTVLINGDEYYWWKNTDTDVNISRRSPWNMYDEDASGLSHKHGYLIRRTASI